MGKCRRFANLARNLHSSRGRAIFFNFIKETTRFHNANVQLPHATVWKMYTQGLFIGLLVTHRVAREEKHFFRDDQRGSLCCVRILCSSLGPYFVVFRLKSRNWRTRRLGEGHHSDLFLSLSNVRARESIVSSAADREALHSRHRPTSDRPSPPIALLLINSPY